MWIRCRRFGAGGETGKQQQFLFEGTVPEGFARVTGMTGRESLPQALEVRGGRRQVRGLVENRWR